MRLLWIAHSLPPAGRRDLNVGGMQRVAEELMAALGARHDVEFHQRVLRSSAGSMSLKTGPYLATLLRHIPRIVSQHHIDVVLFSSMVSGVLAWPLRRKLEALRATTMAIAHGRDVTWPVTPYQRLLPRVFGALSGVIAVSRATGQACTERGLSPEKLDVVPNGLDVTRFMPAVDRQAAREMLHTRFGARLAAETPLLLSVGRQVRRKGFAWFVRNVFPRLPGNVHYWIAGHGPEAPTIERAILSGDFGGRVRLLGQIPDEHLLMLYRTADLLVLPNRPVSGDLEGFGVVMLEAGMCGVPTVAAAIEGIQDVIAEGQNGYLVPTGDAEAFASVITGLLEEPAAREALGRRAARHTQRHFAWPSVADRILRVLVTRSARHSWQPPQMAAPREGAVR